jgi:hypothetical protein
MKLLLYLVVNTFIFAQYFFEALNAEDMHADVMEDGVALKVGVHAYFFPLIMCVVWIYHLLDFLWIYLIAVVTLNVYLRTDTLEGIVTDHKDMIATAQRNDVTCVDNVMFKSDFHQRIAAPCASLAAEISSSLGKSLGSVVSIKLLQFAM